MKSTTETTRNNSTKKHDSDALDIACGANTCLTESHREIGPRMDGSGSTIGFSVYDSHFRGRGASRCQPNHAS